MGMDWGLLSIGGYKSVLSPCYCLCTQNIKKKQEVKDLWHILAIRFTKTMSGSGSGSPHAQSIALIEHKYKSHGRGPQNR